MLSCSENGCILHTKPFKCCFLPNFISDEEFLKSLEKDLFQLKFYEKSNDLYKFHQVILNVTWKPFKYAFLKLLRYISDFF